jgi:putative ABC transport system ATP-binding protein
MEIRLQKITPSYIEKDKISSSSVWGEDIVFAKGKYYHIIAASGRGKTSLIHFIYGLRKDYNGSITYDNKSIEQFDPELFSSFRQSKISIVFQDLRLFKDQTARENLEIKRQLNPYHPVAKIEEMAARLGIANKLDKLARTCSYGEQQRIAIIRSLMQPFDFLLLDEPFSNLDDANRAIAFELINEECRARGASMIFADLKSHEVLKNETILNL